MIDFVNNLVMWITQNAQIIKMTAAVIATIIICIVFIISLLHKRTVTHLSNKVDELSQVINEYQKLFEKIDNLKNVVNTYDITANKTVDKMADVQDIDLNLSKKLDAVLEIMSIAYSTIKNDDVRINIANIVARTKLLDKNNNLISKEQEKLLNMLNRLAPIHAIEENPIVKQTKDKETVKETKENKEPTKIRRC